MSNNLPTEPPKRAYIFCDNGHGLTNPPGVSVLRKKIVGNSQVVANHMSALNVVGK